MWDHNITPPFGRPDAHGGNHVAQSLVTKSLGAHTPKVSNRWENPKDLRTPTPHKCSRCGIITLRARLTAGQPTSHGIPVLPRIKDVPDAQRFLYVDLTNYNGDTINVAIDVVNVYVMGYRSGNKSYILASNAKKPAPTHILFPTAPAAAQSTRTMLPFTGDYPALGAYARRTAQPSASGARNPGSRIHEDIPMLEQIPLGRNELDNAINKLHYAASHSDQAVAFIVIIQIVSEAARFR
ncbi:hypothetical protein TB2_037578 [Malus domestica]